MTRQAIEEYAASMRARYRGAGRSEKGALLTEFCAVTGFHRKAAIRALRRAPAARGPQRRPATAGRPVEVAAALRTLWEAAERPCGKRLAPFLGELADALERHGGLALDAATRARLVGLSAATIDRWLRPVRPAPPRRPRTGPAATGGLAAEVAVRTSGEWADAAPGEAQGDLVAHCGVTTEGFYLTTLTLVDVATGRLELEPVWGKGRARVGGALDACRRRLPVALRAFHTDNGGEFLNGGVAPYCRRRGIRRTRGRPYKKNDQARVEQRNWTAVRRLVGYGRYGSKAAHARLAALYAPLRRYFNVFQPLRKVVAKERVGGRVRKRYDDAATPYRRLLAADVLDDDRRAALDALRPLAEPDRGRSPALADRIPGVPPEAAAG